MATTPSGLAGFTAITMDGDGTLWDFQDVMRRALRIALDELCCVCPGASEIMSVEAMIAIRDQVARELKGRLVSHEAIRLEAFRRTLARVEIEDEELAHRLTTVYLTHRFADIALYPDVIPALEALGPCYRLGLLSNGNSYPERCGLAGRFQFAVFAHDHGVEKPDPRIFDIALERAGCARARLLHVGDSIEHDVLGAKRAGIAVAWLNRQGAPKPEELSPDWEVSTLLDLLPLIGRNRPGQL